jgi:hypothetical protein
LLQLDETNGPEFALTVEASRLSRQSRVAKFFKSI